MGRLDMLWDYQNLDLMMDKYDNMRRNSPLRHKLIELKNYLMEQQEQLLKLNDEAEKKNHILNRINHEYESIVNTFKSDYLKVEGGQVKNVKQLEEMQNVAMELKDKLAKKEEELKNLLKDIQALSSRLEEIRVRMVKAKKEYSGIKARYDSEIDDIQKEYKRLKAQRDELKSKIDDGLIKKYNRLKSSRNTAMVMIEQDCCGGCNMTLAALVLERLKKENGIIECENCGRILYLGRKTDNIEQ